MVIFEDAAIIELHQGQAVAGAVEATMQKCTFLIVVTNGRRKISLPALALRVH